MGHRAKHLRRNWIPERLVAAAFRRDAELKRQEEAAKRREAESDPAAAV